MCTSGPITGPPPKSMAPETCPALTALLSTFLLVACSTAPTPIRDHQDIRVRAVARSSGRGFLRALLDRVDRGRLVVLVAGASGPLNWPWQSAGSHAALGGIGLAAGAGDA